MWFRVIFALLLRVCLERDMSGRLEVCFLEHQSLGNGIRARVASKTFGISITVQARSVLLLSPVRYF
eukprot:scaffold46_cov318-Pavlova_lutheri.AAC.3